jgi:putative transposase
MSRMPRIHIENALYYITCRGDNSEEIFRDESDYNAYLELLKKCKEQSGFSLYAYVFMPNHLHLLIELKGPMTISQIMHGMNSNYTKYFNKRHQKKGHLFQERFELILLEKEPYLLDMGAYIHLNPKTQNASVDPVTYLYSSCSMYSSAPDIRFPMVTEIKEALGLLKGIRYTDFLSDFYLGRNKAMSEELNRKSILGSDAFMEKIKLEVESNKLQDDKAARPARNASSAANKTFIVAGIIVFLALSAISLYLYTNASQSKNKLSAEIANKEKELGVKLVQERSRIVQDLDEKYRADKISYEALTKRLAIEKQKTKELEDKVSVKSVKKPVM